MNAAGATARPAASRLYPWYDSVWLSQFARAKALLRAARPELLASFERAMQVFHTQPDFQPVRLERVFDDATLAEARRIVTTLRPNELELHEARSFGRFVVHNHAYFNELHARLTEMVSAAVGEPVEPFYNFLSLYGRLGVCAVHLDAPEAKYTLDLCLAQSEPWPIHFSQVIPWPATDGQPWPRQDANSSSSPNSRDDWQERIKQSPELRFTAHTLQPGQAVIFSGSSQWHYRDALPRRAAKQFCDLLFFHFIPLGTAELVKPRNWARLFGAPELEIAKSDAFPPK